MPFFEKALDRPRFDTSRSIEGLRGASVACAPIDREWVRRFLALARNVVFE